MSRKSYFWSVLFCLVLGSSGLFLVPAQTTEVRFTATELLGRPTDNSITINMIAGSPVEAYFEYGLKSGEYDLQTPTLTYQTGDRIEVVMDRLQANTKYFYRMQYRKPGGGTFTPRPEFSFQTQRAAGSTFTFTVQSDSHIYDKKGNHTLYEIAMKNQLADAPDFMLDLGDTFGDDHDLSISEKEMDQLHLDQRPFMGIVGSSAPVFLALGNHEGEGGYYLNVNAPNNLAIYGTKARLKYYPNPLPNSFYTGNEVEEKYVGLPQNYYAWTWGDALFVVIDPYRHEPVDPKATKDLWDWTLGKTQYEWLRQTLEHSTAKYKFVFAHHLLGQTRGAVGSATLYEWGGRDKRGQNLFASKRPGWAKPIHQLFVDTNVTIYFQGHDHLYAREVLDGVTYQETPMPSDATYHVGDVNAKAYGGTVANNSGHLRVTVSPSDVTVDYVRAFLPGNGTNRQVSHTYKIPAAK
ncbi:MAG: metallophosphoesterase family protein [Blastocatellia bacterium]|nr:metallophosphoesterase family protein [Blastocatellia bacterium]